MMLRGLRSVLRAMFQSGFVAAGVLLCTLGLANWIVGGIRLAKYERLVVETDAPSGDVATMTTGFTVSHVSEDQERRNIALAKLQYYRVVLVAGQLLLVAGLLSSLIGYVRLPVAGPAGNKTLLDRL